MKKLVPTRQGAFLYAERIRPSLDVASAWNFVTRPPRGPYAERINPSLDVASFRVHRATAAPEGSGSGGG